MAIRTMRYQNDLDQVLDPTAAADGNALALLATANRARPDLADGWRVLADRLAPSDPDGALAAAKRAVALAPADWQNWRSLALIQLQRGDLAASQSSLKRATALDSGFEAHYLLGNVARIEDQPQLAQRELLLALRMATPDGIASALRQLASLGVPTAPIEAILKNSPAPVLARAVMYLADDGQLSGARQAWDALHCTPGDQEVCQWAILHLSAALLVDARKSRGPAAEELASEAQRAWNRAVAADVLPGQELARAGQVQDGDFAAPWLNAPLSWTASGCVDVGQDVASGRGGYAAVFRFDGSEADQCAVIEQWVLAVGQTLDLSLISRAESAAPSDGLTLRVQAMNGEVLASLPVLTGLEWQRSQCRLQVPAEMPLLHLEFVYQRPLGSVRIAAPIWVTAVNIAPSTPAPALRP